MTSLFINKQTNSLTLKICIPQAFVAIATSSGGIHYKPRIDKDINRDVKITTIESESCTMIDLKQQQYNYVQKLPV